MALVATGQRNLAPAASACWRSFPKEAGSWMSMRVTSVAPSRAASAAASHPTLPAPITTTRFPTRMRFALLARRKSRAGRGPLDSGDREHSRFLGPRGDDDVVVLVAELCEGLAAEVLLEMDRRDQSLDPVDLMTDDLVGDAQAGDGARDLSPQLFAPVEDDGLMPLQVKLPGDREARRSRADDSDLVARGLSRLGRFRLEARLAQDGDVHGFEAHDLARAVLHADIRAEVSADRDGERRVGQCDVDGLVDKPLADHLPALLHGDARGAVGLAGRQEFQVFPDGDVAPQNAVRDERDGAAVQIGQIADQPALARVRCPRRNGGSPASCGWPWRPSRRAFSRRGFSRPSGPLSGS